MYYQTRIEYLFLVRQNSSDAKIFVSFPRLFFHTVNHKVSQRISKCE